MQRDRLSDRLVKKLQYPAQGRRIVYDRSLSGFGIRFGSDAKKRREEKLSKVFILNYSINRKERRLRIGEWPTWSTAEAREEATRLRQMIDRGEDPKKASDDEKEEPTVGDLVRLYQDQELPLKQPATQTQYRAILKKIGNRFGKMKVSEVRRGDLEKMHTDLRKNSKGKVQEVAANRALGIASALFSFAVRRELREDNPAHGVRRYREQPRNRYLKPDELRRVIKALNEHSNQDACDAIRLLILTGARKSEVLGMRWPHVDLEQGLWSKPAESTKSRRPHRALLSPRALELLQRRESVALSNEYVFPNRQKDGPRTELTRVWHDIRKEAGLEDVRLHDLRHSYASFVASNGGSLPLIGALLGHRSHASTYRYTHLMDAPLRAAVDSVDAIIGAIVEEASPGGPSEPEGRGDATEAALGRGH